MLEYLNAVLPIIIYILLVILLTLLIIITLKAIKTIQKVDMIVDDVDRKLASFNNFFDIMDLVADKLSILSDRVIDIIANFISKVFSKKKKENIKEENDE